MSGTTELVRRSPASGAARPRSAARRAASVTETIAKRGSTASLKVSATCVGGVFTTPLADGTVRRSAACAHAAAGSRERDDRAPRRPRARRRRLAVTRAHASRADAARRRRRRAPSAPTTSATIASVEVPPPPSELSPRSSARAYPSSRGRSSRRPSRPSRSAGPRTCTSSRAAGSRGTGRPSPRRSGRFPPVQVTFWTTASSPEPVCLHLLASSRGDRRERVDREAGRDGQLDLRRRRALLLGRHRERELLQLLRLGHGRADISRARTRRSEHERARDGDAAATATLSYASRSCLLLSFGGLTGRAA